MGMGYSACSEVVIELEDIFKTGLDSAKDLKEITEANPSLLEVYANNNLHGVENVTEDEETYNKLDKIVNTLEEEFNEKYDIILRLSSHSAEDYGDRYDEVDGPFFAIIGAYELSEGGKKLKEDVHFENKYWVHFG